MAILRPVASSRPGEGESGGERTSMGAHTEGVKHKRTAIDDCKRSLSHFLVLHPFDSRAYWDGFTEVVGYTHHLFCRSALALSTASMASNH